MQVRHLVPNKEPDQIWSGLTFVSHERTWIMTFAPIIDLVTHTPHKWNVLEIGLWSSQFLTNTPPSHERSQFYKIDISLATKGKAFLLFSRNTYKHFCMNSRLLKSNCSQNDGTIKLILKNIPRIYQHLDIFKKILLSYFQGMFDLKMPHMLWDSPWNKTPRFLVLLWQLGTAELFVGTATEGSFHAEYGNSKCKMFFIHDA